ncbi:hypothetical protein [Kineococcus terrestris]|uniref:hypothetical protein n=1 Tax=Kineococcus terrestris TaxID=2044856 RepID=UPI0034DB3CAA
MSKTTSEPLVTAAGISAAVAAVIALLVAFGIDLTEEQTAAILGVVAVLAPIAVAAAARGKVTPTANPRADDGTALAPSTVDLG